MAKKRIHTISVEETASTNALAKELLKEGQQKLPFIVQSNFQTKGKGQFSKVWESNIGENLLFSLVIKAPKIPIEQQFNISKAVAVSIREVLKVFTKSVSIKWPNDIYVDNNKIAGILIENTIIGQQIDSCIKVEVEGNQIIVKRSTEQKRHKALHGLFRTLIANS